ncbi:MAG: IgGFc-binding protein [Polyangiaceae bacterium]
MRPVLLLTILTGGGALGCAAGAGASGGNGGGGFGAGSAAGGDMVGVVGAGGGSSTLCADLKTVADPSGNLTPCPPDQGCLDGQCVEACEAAAAADGSIGCEYWAPETPFSYSGPCYAVFVANTWGKPAKISFSYQGQTYDASEFGRIPSGVGPNTTYAPIPASGLPEGEVAVLFLSHRPGVQHVNGFSLECPITPAVTVDAAVAGSGRGDAFEVLSDTPVTAYDIVPYGGALSFFPSATLLYPRTAWGTNYVVTAPQSDAGFGQAWLTIVGTVDGTTVDVAAKGQLWGDDGVPVVAAGQTEQVTIGAGEIVQWISDPSGAILGSDHPIGVFSGHTKLEVVTATSPDGGGVDSTHQQLPPVAALGAEYVAGGVVTRLTSLAPESVRYRLTGIANDTALSYEPAIAGAPTALQQGESLELETSQRFVVRAQDDDHPFILSQYMPGAMNLHRPGCDPNGPIVGPCYLGDDDWVVLSPPAQFMNRYAFFADPTYATTTLVMARKRGDDGAFADVTVDCLGTVTGWQPVGASDYEVAHVDLVRALTGATPACETARHLAHSTSSFGAVVWGTDMFASYGYPAGGNVAAINDVVVDVPR